MFTIICLAILALPVAVVVSFLWGLTSQDRYERMTARIDRFWDAVAR